MPGIETNVPEGIADMKLKFAVNWQAGRKAASQIGVVVVAGGLVSGFNDDWSRLTSTAFLVIIGILLITFAIVRRLK